MDEYQEFCARAASRFAMEREAEEELQQLRQSTSRIKQRSVEPGGLVYKTHNNGPAPLSQDIDPWAAWNRWCESKIATALHDYTREIAPAIHKSLDSLEDEAQKAFNKLEEALDREREKTAKLTEALDRERERTTKLRGEIEVLRVMVRSQNIGARVRG
jgi:hypothetical protein